MGCNMSNGMRKRVPVLAVVYQMQTTSIQPQGQLKWDLHCVRHLLGDDRTHDAGTCTQESTHCLAQTVHAI